MAGWRLGVVRYSGDGRRIRFQRPTRHVDQRTLVFDGVHFPPRTRIRHHRPRRPGEFFIHFNIIRIMSSYSNKTFFDVIHLFIQILFNSSTHSIPNSITIILLRKPYSNKMNNSILFIWKFLHSDTKLNNYSNLIVFIDFRIGSYSNKTLFWKFIQLFIQFIKIFQVFKSTVQRCFYSKNLNKIHFLIRIK